MTYETRRIRDLNQVSSHLLSRISIHPKATMHTTLVEVLQPCVCLALMAQSFLIVYRVVQVY